MSDTTPDTIASDAPATAGEDAAKSGNPWTRAKVRIQELVAEYGYIALGTWFTIFGLSVLGFSIAIRFGYEPEGGAGSAGIVGSAYLLTQAIKPIRAALTVALTPLVAKVLHRNRNAPPPAPRP